MQTCLWLFELFFVFVFAKCYQPFIVFIHCFSCSQFLHCFLLYFTYTTRTYTHILVYFKFLMYSSHLQQMIWWLMTIIYSGRWQFTSESRIVYAFRFSSMSILRIVYTIGLWIGGLLCAFLVCHNFLRW